MKVCIVGHGPSLLKAGNGTKIDSADIVIRLKQGWKQCIENPDDYGKKIDVLMTSTETLGCFEGSQVYEVSNYPSIQTSNVSFSRWASVSSSTYRTLPRPLYRYWAYPKYGWYEEHRLKAIENHIGTQVEIPLNWINRINWKFRQKATHPNVSLGMAAILYAEYLLKPSEIILAGFDTLLNPDVAFERNSNIQRTGAGPYPDHDWKRENELLQSLKTHVRAI